MVKASDLSFCESEDITWAMPARVRSASVLIFGVFWLLLRFIYITIREFMEVLVMERYLVTPRCLLRLGP